MPHKIVSKSQLSEDVFTADVEAPLITEAGKPGQFVIISISSEYSERIPLTIADADPQKGTIRLIWQRVGKTTAELADMKVGDEIANVVGPLGKPTRIENFGTTDDGSYGRKALVTEPLKELCQRSQKPDQVFAIGPAIMMKFCCAATKQFDVPTQVSLNTIMVDATGMCGGCRIEFDGKPKFVCVDGPEFDGHKVNFDLMMKRLDAYKDQEQKAYEQYKKHRCKIGLDK